MRHHLILRVIAKLLIGPIIFFAFYVQFHGDYSPGGGFQAGVIFAVAFILYGLVFGLEVAKHILPESFVHRAAGLGVLIYAGTGVFSLLRGYEYLNYAAFNPAHPSHGQHWGILAVEAGVGLTVAAVMVTVYYAFAGCPPVLEDEEW